MQRKGNKIVHNYTNIIIFKLCENNKLLLLILIIINKNYYNEINYSLITLPFIEV